MSKKISDKTQTPQNIRRSIEGEDENKYGIARPPVPPDPDDNDESPPPTEK